MDRKTQLIKAILQKDSKALNSILSLNPELIFFSPTEAKGIVTDSAGNTYTLLEVEQLADKTGTLVFLPVDALTDEQIDAYLNFNQ